MDRLLEAILFSSACGSAHFYSCGISLDSSIHGNRFITVDRSQCTNFIIKKMALHEFLYSSLNIMRIIFCGLKSQSRVTELSQNTNPYIVCERVSIAIVYGLQVLHVNHSSHKPNGKLQDLSLNTLVTHATSILRWCPP